MSTGPRDDLFDRYDLRTQETIQLAEDAAEMEFQLEEDPSSVRWHTIANDTIRCKKNDALIQQVLRLESEKPKANGGWFQRSFMPDFELFNL